MLSALSTAAILPSSSPRKRLALLGGVNTSRRSDAGTVQNIVVSSVEDVTHLNDSVTDLCTSQAMAHCLLSANRRA